MGGSDRLGFINRSTARRTEEGSTIQAHLRPYLNTKQSSGGPRCEPAPDTQGIKQKGSQEEAEISGQKGVSEKLGGKKNFRYLAQGEKYMWCDGDGM